MTSMKNTRVVADVAVAIERSKYGQDLHERFMDMLGKLDGDREALIRQVQSLTSQLANLKANGIVARDVRGDEVERLNKQVATRQEEMQRLEAENEELRALLVEATQIAMHLWGSHSNHSTWDRIEAIRAVVVKPGEDEP